MQVNNQIKNISKLATASMYLGLLSMIISPVPAIVCGHLALREIKKTKNLSGKGRAYIGLILAYSYILFMALHFLPTLMFVKFLLIPPKINFHEKEWTELQINYWFRKEGEVNYRPNKRQLIINDPILLNEIRNYIKIKKVTPNTLGNHGQIVAKLKRGDEWLIDIVFENKISLNPRKNPGYSYYLELQDTKFYDKLFEIIFINEKRANPEISEKNIVFGRSDIIPKKVVIH